MTDTPIPQQQGLSQKDLDKMKPVEQKFTPDSPASLKLTPQHGTQTQQSNIAAKLHSILVAHEKRMKKLDNKDEYAVYNELDKLADEITDFIIDLIKTQAVSITTTDSTTDTLTGTQTTTTTPPVTTPMVLSGTGTGTGTATPQQVIIQ